MQLHALARPNADFFSRDAKHQCTPYSPKVGTISRKTSDSTDKYNGQNLLDIAVTNALELLRGQNFEN
jgi:hypothetical protein